MAFATGSRWRCAAFAVSALATSAAAEDFCADFWTKMPANRRDEFMTAADTRAAEKTPPAQRAAFRSCLAARRPSLRATLDRACASGEAGGPSSIVGILESSLTPCLESLKKSR